jgi:citrate synthase
MDFYSGIIYQAMGFPVEVYPVLFAIGRMPGWLAQWQEMLEDKEQKIARPRQVYVGHDTRDFVPIGQRGLAPAADPPAKEKAARAAR